MGIPLKTDKYTKDKIFLKYARVLINIPLDRELPEYLEFINDHGVLTRQSVVYEWKPTRCDYCKTYGHKEEECRKKAKTHLEWRPVVKTKGSDPPAKPQPQHNTIDDGFT